MKIQHFTAFANNSFCTRCLYSHHTKSFRRITTQSKYADKLKQKSEQTGQSVKELFDTAKAVKEAQRHEDVEELKKAAEKLRKQSRIRDGTPVEKYLNKQSLTERNRKDAPPYKELSRILNLQRLLATPHTAEQISGLWTAYHASRSGGTGRGFICASIPLSVYEMMAENGRDYPLFVVPVPRVQPQPESTSEALPSNSQENTAHEFYYLQWNFHPSPPIPAASDDPFLKPAFKTSDGVSNPATATVLYAPLQEYKLRQAFATPYLVLTMYTDLAATHGIVLLRGEITPSTGAGQGSPSTTDKYMLSQEDAQLLTIALQRFYLWSDKGTEFGKKGMTLLTAFHKTPHEFDWKDLLKFSDPTI